MSAVQTQSKSKIGILALPGGVEVAVELRPKVFSTGNTGWTILIPRFAYENHTYGGNGNVFRMDRKQDAAREAAREAQ